MNNVTGNILNPPNPPQTVSAAVLAGPQAPTTRFVSALFQSSATNWDVLTFGNRLLALPRFGLGQRHRTGHAKWSGIHQSGAQSNRINAD